MPNGIDSFVLPEVIEILSLKNCVIPQIKLSTEAINNTLINVYAPIYAPIAAISLTSPPPIPFETKLITPIPKPIMSPTNEDIVAPWYA